MRNIRAVIKIFCLLFFTLVTYSIYIIVYWILPLLQQPYEPWRNFFMRSWSKGFACIFNIKFRVTGIPPEPPFILVSNHLSYIDILPMFLNMRCTFVAKKEVESWPVLGRMVKNTGVIFVDRAVKKDVKRVNKLLAQGYNKYQGIVLFPEGTTTGGDKVLPFRSSLLNYPATQSIPVYYSAIQYRTSSKDPPANETVCFYNARDPFHKHVFKLASNREIECMVRYGETPIQLNDRKELAETLQKHVEDISASIR